MIVVGSPKEWRKSVDEQSIGVLAVGVTSRPAVIPPEFACLSFRLVWPVFEQRIFIYIGGGDMAWRGGQLVGREEVAVNRGFGNQTKEVGEFHGQVDGLPVLLTGMTYT